VLFRLHPNPSFQPAGTPIFGQARHPRHPDLPDVRIESTHNIYHD